MHQSDSDCPYPSLRAQPFLMESVKGKGSNSMKGLPAGRATLSSVWTLLQLHPDCNPWPLHHFTAAQSFLYVVTVTYATAKQDEVGNHAWPEVLRETLFIFILFHFRGPRKGRSPEFSCLLNFTLIFSRNNNSNKSGGNQTNKRVCLLSGQIMPGRKWTCFISCFEQKTDEMGYLLKKSSTAPVQRTVSPTGWQTHMNTHTQGQDIFP